MVATAAELREPHRVARYLEDTTAVFNKWYDTRECRMLPQGDEPVAPINQARAGADGRSPRRCSPTASTCSASPRPSGCRPACAPRGRAGPTPRCRCAARRGCASPATSTRWSRSCGRRPRARSTAPSRSAASRLTDLVAEHGSPAYVLDEADFRAAPRPSGRVRRAGRSSTPARRSSARPSPAGSREEGLSLDVCSGGELAVALRAGFPIGADRLPRQQQDGRRARARRRARGRADHRRLLPRDRAAGGDHRASSGVRRG